MDVLTESHDRRNLPICIRRYPPQQREIIKQIEEGVGDDFENELNLCHVSEPP